LRKGLGPVAIALIAIVVILVTEAVFLTNFIVRVESVVRTIREGEIILAINEMEFVKKALNQALPYSFYQSFYYIASRGGYLGFGHIPSYNCIPYWRNYAATNYPNNLKENLAEVLLKTFNGYGSKLEDPVSIPKYTSVSIEEKQIKTGEKTCEGTASSCNSFDPTDKNGCKNQAGCSWCGCWVWTLWPLLGYCKDVPLPNCLLYSPSEWRGCEGTATPCKNLTPETCTSQKGCHVLEKFVSGIGVNFPASGDLKITDDFEISEKGGFSKDFVNKFFDLFKIGKEKFVDSDSIGDSIKNAVSAHACSDSKDAVTSGIISQISNLQTNLNSQYSAEKINFNLNVEKVEFDPSCNSTVAVRVLTRMTDTSSAYPVYDFIQGTVALRNVRLNFYVLNGNYIIQTTTSSC